MFRKKENQKLDQIISQLSSSDLHKTLENKIESINKDLDRYQGWYWKEADIAKKLKQIQSELELKVFTLEKQIEFYKNNEENFNSLKKELGERLNKVNRQERLLDDRQITLDTKLEEISKQWIEQITREYGSEVFIDCMKLTGILFLKMVPLHYENPEHQDIFRNMGIEILDMFMTKKSKRFIRFFSKPKIFINHEANNGAKILINYKIFDLLKIKI